MKAIKVLKIFTAIILTVIVLFAVFFINGMIEKPIINSHTAEFKSRAYSKEAHPHEANVFIYKVKKEYDYEDTSKRAYDGLYNIGTKGDILITNRVPRTNDPTFQEVLRIISKYIYIGHTALISTEDGDSILEIVGNDSDPDYNVVQENYNDWNYRIADIATQEIIGLRIKGITEEQVDGMVEYGRDQIGKGYNYTFLFNRRDKYYCSDLITRASEHVGININYDYLIALGNDMILSKNTYIFFFKESLIEDGVAVHHVYYLSDE